MTINQRPEDFTNKDLRETYLQLRERLTKETKLLENLIKSIDTYLEGNAETPKPSVQEKGDV